MKLQTKAVSVFIATLLILGGCSPQKSPVEQPIVVWHWMNDRQATFNALADQYLAETGIRVEFKLFSPPDIYSQKVIAAARAGNLPDIFGILGEKKTLASFIKAGHILDLTPYLESNQNSWKRSFYPQALAVSGFNKDNEYGVNPGMYAIPIDMTLIEFLYNKTLFEKAGLDPDSPPLNFEEFIAMAKKIKEEVGADGFVCGWGEGWLLNVLAVEWAINLMGENKFLATIQGNLPYTDPEWIEVFSLFEKMREADILAPNITTMINKEAEDAFSKNKSAFAFNGSWSINVYRQLAPELEYAFFALPRVSDRFPVKIWGGAGSSFMVNAHSNHKEKVVDFLKWFTAKEQQEFLVAETNNLPAIKGCEEDLSPLLAGLVNDFGRLTHRNIWPRNEDSPVIEVTIKSLQQIVMGLKTPAEAAAEIQAVKERTLQR